MEVCVDGHCHVVADAHHSTECVGAETEVSILAHILERLSLLLHRVVVAAETVNLEALALYL